MAESVGGGIALQGKNRDYSQQWINIFNRGGELAYRRDQIKKKKEADEFAKLTDFGIDTKDVTPLHAHLIAKEMQGFINEVSRIKNQNNSTWEQASRESWKAHADTKANIQKYKYFSDGIKEYKKANPTTQNAPMQAEVDRLFSKTDTTPEEIATALNKPELGVSVVDPYGITANVYEKVDLKKEATDFNKNPVIDIDWMKKNPPIKTSPGRVVIPTMLRSSPEDRNAFVESTIGNRDKLFQLYLDAQNVIGKERPDLIDGFFSDPDKQRETGELVAKAYMTSTLNYPADNLPQPSAASQAAAKKQPTLTHSVTEVFPTREQLAENPVRQKHNKNIDAMRKAFDENTIEGKKALTAAGVLDESGKLIEGGSADERKDIENKKIEVIDELITKNHPNFFKENERSERLNTFTIEKADDRQNVVFEFKSEGKVYKDVSASDIIIRNNKPYLRGYMQSTGTKEGVPSRSREIEVPYEGSTRAILNVEYKTDNLLREKLEELGVDADKIMNAWDKKGTSTQKSEPKKTKKDDPLGLFD